MNQREKGTNDFHTLAQWQRYFKKCSRTRIHNMKSAIENKTSHFHALNEPPETTEELAKS